MEASVYMLGCLNLREGGGRQLPPSCLLQCIFSFCYTNSRHYDPSLGFLSTCEGTLYVFISSTYISGEKISGEYYSATILLCLLQTILTLWSWAKFKMEYHNPYKCGRCYHGVNNPKKIQQNKTKGKAKNQNVRRQREVELGRNQ